MSVKRSGNFLNQLRVDTPMLRSIESAVRNDFDELLSSFAIGESASYVIRGFEISMAAAIGNSASSLQMIVDGSSLFHGASTQAGTFFQVPTGSSNEVINSTTNTRVQGSFTPGTLNYVGIEFTRTVDNSTAAQVFLWNPTNKTEVSKTAPLAEILDYNIVVTSSTWASNVIPISLVETDNNNAVIHVEDRRPMLFRLGTAGTNTPNPFNTYSVMAQENFWSSNSATSPFEGGDKQIPHFKGWADAVMSRILKIQGTTYWYEENTSVGSLAKLKGDVDLIQMTGSGVITHSATVPGRLNWSSDIYLNYIGSRLSYKISSNAATTDITLADDQVAYFKIVRGVDIVPSIIFTNGSSTVSSVGAVSWTSNVIAGDFIKIASADDTKYYKISTVDPLLSHQVTLTSNYLETSTGSGGTLAQYAWGTYQTNLAPSTDRHLRVVNRKDVPHDQDIYWIFLRADNGGSTPRVYIKGSSGGELQQGEDRGISDNQSLEILTYVGSASEVDVDPSYTNIPNGLAAYSVTQGDNLTLAIGQTMGNVNSILTALDQPCYDEFYQIVALLPTGNQLLGPVLSGTTLTLPINSRLIGSPQQNYIVGKGTLEIYLNGQVLQLGEGGGWTEVGVSLSSSTQIIINQQLEVGDFLTFRIDGTGGPGGGGGGGAAADDNFYTLPTKGTNSDLDYILIYDVAANAYKKQTRAVFLAGLSNITNVRPVIADWTLLSSDDFIVADTTLNLINLTLPSSALNPGKKYMFKKANGNPNDAVILVSGLDLIDGSSSFSFNGAGITNFGSVTLISDGLGNWWVF